MPVTGSDVLSHGAPLLFPLYSTSACSRPPLRLTPHTRTSYWVGEARANKMSRDTESNWVEKIRALHPYCREMST
eukprot:6517159-Prymnesium_polylepis.1